jgi:hypothetical protein
MACEEEEEKRGRGILQERNVKVLLGPAGIEEELIFTVSRCEKEKEEVEESCREGFWDRTLACYKDPKEEDWKNE